MNSLLEIITSTNINKKFINSNLVEKSFKDWSKKFLETHTPQQYTEKLFDYFRLIEAIDFQEIEDANKHKKVTRMIKLFDRLQLACEHQELKIFTIDELKTNFYHIHPFIYGLMLHFYDLKFSEEIDEKITYLTQWIEEIAYSCDAFNQRELKKIKS